MFRGLRCAAPRFAGARAAAPRHATRRPASTSGVITSIYENTLKSNISHVTFVVVGAIIFEIVYGHATEMLWESQNANKLAGNVDWSTFLEKDDEEEEEEAAADEEEEEKAEEEEEEE